jgi:D-alanyl-D-alanine carboxypeptidase
LISLRSFSRGRTPDGATKTLVRSSVVALVMLATSATAHFVVQQDLEEGSAHSGAGGEAKAASAGGFESAAPRNRISRDTLRWAFGGKLQQGWSIYVPLIQQTIGVRADADSYPFARAVARWQQGKGLQRTGVLDERSWSAMVGQFQSERIKDRNYPSNDELVEVPASEFYDPDRPVELRLIERRTYAAYTRMVAAALRDPSLGLKVGSDGKPDADEKYLKIISAFRSRQYQDQLRRAAPHSTRAGLAVNSPHFTGRALDLYVGGDPVSTKDSNRLLQTRTPVYNWLVRHAGEFGFHPYFYEPWHWELVR